MLRMNLRALAKTLVIVLMITCACVRATSIGASESKDGENAIQLLVDRVIKWVNQQINGEKSRVDVIIEWLKAPVDKDLEFLSTFPFSQPKLFIPERDDAQFWYVLLLTALAITASVKNMAAMMTVICGMLLASMIMWKSIWTTMIDLAVAATIAQPAMESLARDNTVTQSLTGVAATLLISYFAACVRAFIDIQTMSMVFFITVMFVIINVKYSRGMNAQSWLFAFWTSMIRTVPESKIVEAIVTAMLPESAVVLLKSCKNRSTAVACMSLMALKYISAEVFKAIPSDWPNSAQLMVIGIVIISLVAMILMLVVTMAYMMVGSTGVTYMAVARYFTRMYLSGAYFVIGFARGTHGFADLPTLVLFFMATSFQLVIFGPLFGPISLMLSIMLGFGLAPKNWYGGTREVVATPARPKFAKMQERKEAGERTKNQAPKSSTGKKKKPGAVVQSESKDSSHKRASVPPVVVEDGIEKDVWGNLDLMFESKDSDQIEVTLPTVEDEGRENTPLSIMDALPSDDEPSEDISEVEEKETKSNEVATSVPAAVQPAHDAGKPKRAPPPSFNDVCVPFGGGFATRVGPHTYVCTNHQSRAEKKIEGLEIISRRPLNQNKELDFITVGEEHGKRHVSFSRNAKLSGLAGNATMTTPDKLTVVKLDPKSNAVLLDVPSTPGLSGCPLMQHNGTLLIGVHLGRSADGNKAVIGLIGKDPKSN